MLLKKLLDRMGSLRSHVAGSAALIFALGAPAVFGFVAASVDYARLSHASTQLQYAADEAALLGARELALATMSDDQIKASTQAFVPANAGYATNFGLSSTVAIEADRRSVKVNARITVPFTFAQVFGLKTQAVTRSAVASLLGDAQLCVLTLNTTDGASFSLTGSARVTAPQCSAYANANNPQGLAATGSSVLTSSKACVVGGYQGNSANFAPVPKTGCPTHADPLSSIIPPTADLTGCTKNLVVNASTTLSPGTFCGGITVNAGANVTLSPGVYIMNGGDFHLTGSSQVHGTNVAIYFNGSTGTFKADPKTTIDLTAPKTGALAGFLIYQDSTANPGQDFHISSSQADNLLGTIYLPQGYLTVDSGAKVADASAYTVIIAQKLIVNGSTNLTLNAMYSSTDVPVPTNTSKAGAKIVLVQ